MARKKKGLETPRRKAAMPAKSGKRHILNPNHPKPRPAEQARAMRKEVS